MLRNNLKILLLLLTVNNSIYYGMEEEFSMKKEENQSKYFQENKIIENIINLISNLEIENENLENLLVNILFNTERKELDLINKILIDANNINKIESIKNISINIFKNIKNKNQENKILQEITKAQLNSLNIEVRKKNLNKKI